MIPLRSSSFGGQARLRKAGDVVTIGRQAWELVTYRMTEEGQKCRFRLSAPEPLPGRALAEPEYVELLASSSRILPAAGEPATEASVA